MEDKVDAHLHVVLGRKDFLSWTQTLSRAEMDSDPGDAQNLPYVPAPHLWGGRGTVRQPSEALCPHGAQQAEQSRQEMQT